MEQIIRLENETNMEYIIRATNINQKLKAGKKILTKYHEKKLKLGIINKNTQFTKKTITNM